MSGRAIEDIYPLSPTQRGMLSHLLSEPSSRAYFEQFHCELRGELDGDAFAAAWRAVVARQPVLRTAFEWEEADEPLQVVLDEASLPLTFLDWRDLTAEERDRRLEDFLRRDREQGFALDQPPLMRLALIRVAADRHRFVWSHHHLLLDGWCRPLLFDEVFTFYEAARRGATPRLGRVRPFRDYIAWLKERDAGEAERFWRGQLDGYHGTDLAAAVTPPGGTAERRGDDFATGQLSAGASRELEAAARRSGVTLNTVAQAAWALLFSRYGGGDDLAFGIVVSGRPPELDGVESMVGLFINSLPMRVRIPWQRPLAAWLPELQHQSLDLVHHSHVFLGDLRRWCELPAGRRLFDSLLAFQNFPVGRALAERAGVEVGASSTFELSEFPLSIVVEPGARIGLWLGFDPRHVGRAMAVRMLRQYEGLLGAMAAAPESWLSELPVLVASERWQLLGEWNDTGAAPPRLPVHAAVAARARQAGLAAAVIAGGRVTTYRELVAQAGGVARALAAAGLRPGALVAVLVERTPEHLAALLGVLAAGAAFLPLDATYPRERLRALLDDAGAAALLAAPAAVWSDLGAAGRPVIDLATAAGSGEGEALPVGWDDGLGGDSTACVFYTSGSTGKPKGVAVGHQALACFAAEMAERLALGPADRMLQFASPAFDVLLEELFPVWLRGGAVVLESRATLGSPQLCAAAMGERGVTVAELPAAYFHAWVAELEETGGRPPAALRLLMVGAEKPAVDRLAAWQRYGIPLLYVFGLTETAVTSSVHLLAADRPAAGELPIGRPLAGVRYFVTDAGGDLAPLGTAGELRIGGWGIAAGYLGRPETTAERFVPDPFSGQPGARLYRTGDLVRHRPDGEVDLLGRIDAQFKLRGFRIEPGEIEAALARHPAVANAAVVVRQQAAGAGERQLVAWVSPAPAWQAVGAPVPEAAAGSGAGGAVQAGTLLRERRLELWLSHGEHPLYDPAIYRRMAQDEERNRRYRDAIRRRVAGKVVVDVGTGAEAVLARFCAEAGARKVYAIERSPEACAAARALVQRLGLAGRIELLLGEATELEPPERADVCVSELIGTIGGAEGAAVILERVRRRWLAPGGEMVPRRCITRIAAVELPEELRQAPRLSAAAAHYAGKVLGQLAAGCEPRVCVRNLDPGALLSESDVFEDLDFAAALPERYERDIALRVTRPGRLDALLLWIELEPEAGDAVSALVHDCSWLPMLVPLDAAGEAVAPGDLIAARVGGRPAADGVHPDYWVEGRLERQGGGQAAISYRSPYREADGPRSWFAERLLAGNERGELAPEGRRITAQDLRQLLAKALPEHMVPAAYASLPELPVTPNGKLDRRALAARADWPGAPAAAAAESAADAPRDEVEEILVGIFRDVLGVPAVGIHANFFELGGDSILSIQVAARARRHGIALAPWQLFEEDTVAKLAALVATQRAAAAATAPAPAASAPAAVAADLPLLTPIQRWFFAQELPHPEHWNMSLLLAMRERQAPGLLRRALAAVAARHQALACRFVRDGGGWRPELAANPVAPALGAVDLSRLPAGAWPAALAAAAGRIQRGFELGRAPLLAAAWFALPEGETRLLLAAHHLVVDAVSWRLLVEELETACAQLQRGEPVELPAEPIGFADWSRRLAAIAGSAAAESDHWLDPARAAAAPLPVDFPEGQNREAQARSVRLTVSGFSGAAGGTVLPGSHVQDLLLAALARAVGRFTGGRAFLVDLEGHGREGVLPGIDPSRTVGWFATVYPVLLEATAALEPAAALEAVRRRLRAVPRRGIGHGLLRWLGDAPTRAALAAGPAAEISFNYLGQVAGGGGREGALFTLASEGIGPGASPAGRRGHLLEINAWLRQGDLELEWTFGEDVHRRATIEALADDHRRELLDLVATAAAREAPGGRFRGAADFPLAALDAAAAERLAGALDGRGEVEDVYLQSPLQQGMLLHGLLAPGEGMYVAQLVCDLAGALDVAAMAAAWRFAIDRHGVLRTAFLWEELDRPVQVVYRRAAVTLCEVDLRALPEAEREGRFAACLRADRQRGFDAAAAPLLRLCLFRFGAHRRLLFTFHQMLLDGWSLPLLLADVLAAYEAALAGAAPRLPVRRPYRDYVAWWLRQDAALAESSWRRAMDGVRPLPLPRDGRPAAGRAAGPPGAAPEYTEERLRLPAARLAGLQEFARRHHLTVATLAQAAWGLVLGRMSGAAEAVLGVVVSGRPEDLADVESAVGLYVNTLPLRVPLAGAQPIGDWLHELQRRGAEMRRFQHTPLAEVQGWAGMTPQQPLFESILVFQNYPVEAALAGRWQALGVGASRTYEQTHYALTLVVEPVGELQLTVSFALDAFRRPTVARLLRQLQGVLEELPRSERVGDLGGLDAAERHQLIVEWNDAVAAAAAGTEPVLAGFLRHAQAHPERVAAVFERAELTAGDLVAASSRLAAYLQRQGVGPETAVAVLLERSLAPLIALLAVFQAGGVFVPIDPAQPAERVALFVAEARAALVLTQSSLLPALPALPVPVVCLDAAGLAAELRAADGPPAPAADPAHLAYVIFTSGSTGRPKAVAVEQRQLAHYVQAVRNRLALPDGASFATVSSFATDLGHTAIFPALAGGGCLHIVAESRVGDPEAVAEQLARHPVDCLKIVPSHLAVLLSGRDPRAVLPRRCLVLGGEAADPGLVERLRELAPELAIHNHYGPTETTVGASTWRLAAGPAAPSSPPIGRPLAGCALHLLGDGRLPLPVGALGELAIGGRGVARGYLGQPAATAERFVPDPFAGAPGARLYRTGDLARRRADGSVEFLGRIDGQVKVRGYRVEVAEVEGVLRGLDGVVEAAVALVGESAVERGLGGWVVRQDGAAHPDAAELRAALRRVLPDYMVPSLWVFPAALPRLASGKLDRRALAAAALADGALADLAPGSARVGPRNPLEERVAAVWAAVLRRPEIGVHDDFFAQLGGHSLLATQAVSRLRRELGVELPLRSIFDQPTVAGLAALVAEQLAGEAESGELERLLDELENLPAAGGGAAARP